MLTDGDLDTGLVELDGSRPGDETGTEKKYLVDHDCDLLCEWVLDDRRSEGRSRVKSKFTTLPSQWLIKVYPGLVLGNRQPFTNPHQTKASCRDVGLQMFRQSRKPYFTEPQAARQISTTKALTLEEPAGYNFLLHTCTSKPFSSTLVRPSSVHTHKGYQIVFFTRIAIMSAMDMFWAAPPVARYATSNTPTPPGTHF